jgi:hypothetical protein
MNIHYSFIHRWLYSSLLGSGRLSGSVIVYTVGGTPWMGDQPVRRPQNKRRHIRVERDSNARPHCLGGRRHFLPWSAWDWTRRKCRYSVPWQLTALWARALELQFFLRPTDSRPVRLGIGLPYGIFDQILSSFSADKYLILLSKASSLTRKRVCSLQCNHSLVPITIHYRLIWDCVPFLSPLTTRRDYSGGILTRLHMGKREIFLLYHI